MLSATDWGPAIFSVLVPLLSAGVVLALRVASRQGQLAEQVHRLRQDMAQLEGEVRMMLRAAAVWQRGHPGDRDSGDLI